MSGRRDWSSDFGQDFGSGTPVPPSNGGAIPPPGVAGRGDIIPYLALIPSANRQQPKFLAWASTLLQGLADARYVAESMQALFDIDNAIGDQLDKVGEWVGVSRVITEPLSPAFFSWGIPGLGWGQALWASPYEPPNSQVVILDDAHYRILLKARIASNYWDGTIPGAYQAWDALFAPEGFSVLIQNVQEAKPLPPGSPAGARATGNMHIVLGLIGPPVDALTKALFTGGYLSLRSAGVAIDAYATQSVPGRPYFGWGVGPTTPGDYTSPPVNLAGWGMGCWADWTGQPVYYPLPKPNLIVDTSVAAEVGGSSIRTADIATPIEYTSHTWPGTTVFAGTGSFSANADVHPQRISASFAGVGLLGARSP